MPAWVNFRRWSITTRLSFLFALSSLVLVAVMGVYLYRASDAELDQEFTQQLADTVDFVRLIVGRQKDVTALTRPHFWDALSTPGSRLHMFILSDRNEVLVATSSLKIPPGILPAPAADGRRVTISTVWSAPDGHSYRIVAGDSNFGEADVHPVLIVLALDITAAEQRLRAYNKTLIGTLLIGAICAAALGYFITRRGLAPVRRIAKTAREITSARLERKLELEDAPVELRELATAFNGMLDRLRDSFSRLSQFSSDIAHELRTPINNLMGEAQVALSKARTADEYREALESNVEEYERLARMIENMLFLARADDPQTEIGATLLDAGAELAKICEFFEVIAEDSGVSIRCTGNAKIFADPLLFRRAIGNLLSNALRHTPRGGEIVLKVKPEPGGGVATVVTNPGPGIPAHLLNRIFDRLYRIESSRQKTTEGAGLGLAIVKSIMDLHRGTVSVESVPDGLTAFTLHFPPADKTSA